MPPLCEAGITIYAPVVYMARAIMVSSGQYALRGRFIGVGPGFETFLGPGMARAKRVSFGPKKVENW